MSLVPREAITPTNQGPIFLIVTWILQAAVLLAVGVKVLLLYTSVGLHSDDWCILIAAVLSIAEVIAVSFQGLNGIGKVQSTLSPGKLAVYQKSGYAGELLYILTLAASKLSVVFFIHHITPFNRYQRIAIAIGALVVSWSLASFFVVAFQCHSPEKWSFAEGQCINQTAFWTSYGCINIVTELALVMGPFEMFFDLMKSTSKRFILMFCFSLRLSVVAVIALQIYFVHHPVYPPGYGGHGSYLPPAGFTFSSWPVVLSNQIVQCLSIITTCLPFMRALFEGLETGMIQTGHVSRRTFSVANYDNRVRTNSSQARTWRESSTAGAATQDLLAQYRLERTPSISARARQHSDSSLLLDPLTSPSDPRSPDRTWNSTAHNSRGPTAPPLPRLHSSTAEAAHGRRYVSMIAEDEEEEEHHVHFPTLLESDSASVPPMPELAPFVGSSTLGGSTLGSRSNTSSTVLIPSTVDLTSLPPMPDLAPFVGSSTLGSSSTVINNNNSSSDTLHARHSRISTASSGNRSSRNRVGRQVMGITIPPPRLSLPWRASRLSNRSHPTESQEQISKVTE